MADKYGTDCGVKGMKNYLHIFIKGAFVLFLIAYLAVLYTSDSAKNVPMEQIAQTMEQDSDITSLNKEARSDLKHYYQTDDRNIDGYFFYKAASPMAVEEICIMKATEIPRQILCLKMQTPISPVRSRYLRAMAQIRWLF